MAAGELKMKLDKLTIATAFAFALCLGSLAARSHALRTKATPAPSIAQPQQGDDQLVVAAIDGHLRAKLHRLARR